MFLFILACQKLVNPTRLLTYSIFAAVGADRRGRLVEWVEKASFNRLNILFEITVSERNYQTLLSSLNLPAVVRETQSYTLNILPRRLPKVVVSEEHFVLKDFPFYVKAREVDAKSALAIERKEGKKGPCGGPLVRNVVRHLFQLVLQWRRRRKTW